MHHSPGLRRLTILYRGSSAVELRVLMQNDEHWYSSSIIAGIPDLVRETVRPRRGDRIPKNLSGVEVLGLQTPEKCCPIYAPPALFRLPKIVPCHYARVCEPSKTSEEPRLRAPTHDSRSTDIVGRHADQSLPIHAVDVYLIFDISFIDNHKFVLVDGGNILEAGFFIFRKDVIECAGLCGLGNVNGDQLVIRCIVVGYEVELRTVIRNAA